MLRLARAFSSSVRRRHAHPAPVTLNRQELPTLKNQKHTSEARSPLIILHGLLGSLSNFRSIGAMPELSTNRRVFCVDLRNHGTSPHSDEFSLEAMAEDVVQLMDDEGIDKCSVLGHSLGGSVAMVLALRARERMDKVVVADVAPINYERDSQHWSSLPNILGSLRALDLSKVKARKDAQALLADKIPDTTVRSFVLQNLVLNREEPGKTLGWKEVPSTWQFRWRVNLDAMIGALGAAFDYDWERASYHEHHLGGAYDGPTLFVGGGKADYIVESRGDRDAITRVFPNARVEMMPDAGHWLHFDDPKQFVRIVGDFIN